MKYKAAFKKDCYEVCKKLRWEFYVHEYEMKIAYMSDDKDEDDNDKKVLAEIPIDTKYLNFRVKVYPALQELWFKSKDEFFNVLVHEFSHLLTEPFYNVIIDIVSKREQEYIEEIRERQTQRITNIIAPLLIKKIITKHKAKKKKLKKKRK